MHTRLQSGIGHALATLALSLTLATPALADHLACGCEASQGKPQCHCPGHGAGHSHGMHGGRADCPAMQGMPPAAAAGGKILGVLISDLSNTSLDERGIGYGVQVRQVQADSAAAAAGIEAGDLITEFAGKPVTSGDRLRWLVRQAEPGKAVDIRLLRDNQPVTLNVTLTEPAPKGGCRQDANPRLGT